jgi:carboxyl-terminal processing protease
VVGVRDNYPTVISPIEGTPAWTLGLQTGDVIVEIEGKSTAGFTVEEVADQLRGPKGTQVKIRVRREGEDQPLDFTITRDIIRTKSVPYAFMAAPRVGYVRVANFSEQSGAEVRRAVETLARQGATSLVMDLRSNPGGLLSQAVDVAEELLPTGQLVVYTQGRGKAQDNRYFASEPHPRLDWPAVVLVDRASASASEIVAGALQDVDRALLIGERTYGKGSVQSVFPLRSGEAALKLTTALYYTPSGRSIHRREAANPLAEDELASRPAPPDTAAPVFRTSSGRQVRGGGGILPDVVLTPDTLPALARKAEMASLPFKFANRYAAQHPGLPRDFVPNDAVWREFVAFMASQQPELSAELPRADRAYLGTALHRELARRLAGDSAAVRVALREDQAYRRALAVLEKAKRPQDVFALAAGRTPPVGRAAATKREPAPAGKN